MVLYLQSGWRFMEQAGRGLDQAGGSGSGWPLACSRAPRRSLAQAGRLAGDAAADEEGRRAAGRLEQQSAFVSGIRLVAIDGMCRTCPAPRTTLPSSAISATMADEAGSRRSWPSGSGSADPDPWRGICRRRPAPHAGQRGELRGAGTIPPSRPPRGRRAGLPRFPDRYRPGAGRLGPVRGRPGAAVSRR